jgi:hypothetical protein
VPTPPPQLEADQELEGVRVSNSTTPTDPADSADDTGVPPGDDADLF